MRTRTIKFWRADPDFFANLSEDSTRSPRLVLVSRTFTLPELREYNRNRKRDAWATRQALRGMGLA